MVAPRLMLTASPSYPEFIASARRLIGVGSLWIWLRDIRLLQASGAFGSLERFGASPMRLPRLGLGLRLVALVNGGLSIVIPILFLRVGAAIHARDHDARRLWTRLGIACAGAVAIAAAGCSFSSARQSTGHGRAGSSRFIRRNLSRLRLSPHSLWPKLFCSRSPRRTRLSPDNCAGCSGLRVPPCSQQARWARLLFPPPTRGAGMLAGATLVIGVVVLISLLCLARNQSSQVTSEGFNSSRTAGLTYRNPKPRRPQPRGKI